jgi:hypothetical protein
MKAAKSLSFFPSNLDFQDSMIVEMQENLERKKTYFTTCSYLMTR